MSIIVKTVITTIDTILVLGVYLTSDKDKGTDRAIVPLTLFVGANLVGIWA